VHSPFVRAPLALLLAVPLLAGCVDPGGLPGTQTVPDIALRLTALAPAVEVPATCDPVCPLIKITIDPEVATGRLAATLRWDGTATPGFRPTIVGPDGEPTGAKRGFDAARVRVRDAPAGDYVLQPNGTGDFVLALRLDWAAAATPDGLLLPNLVTLVPEEVQVRGCTRTEQLEQNARRCLRLGNGVGNVGVGPLEVRLEIPDGVLSVGGLGNFVQNIYTQQGKLEQHRVAGAQFHVTHAHFHYAGLAGFQLFQYDLDAGLRGEPVSSMKKSGFCFIDIDEMDQEETKTGSGRYGFLGCFAPDPNGWMMGVSTGWYDYYHAGLDEQYVEISGVPDGVYELVSIADQANTLRESDETDNAASVVLRLTGDRVDVLHRRGFWTVPA
jgi:hypothetical protein